MYDLWLSTSIASMDHSERHNTTDPTLFYGIQHIRLCLTFQMSPPSDSKCCYIWRIIYRGKRFSGCDAVKSSRNLPRLHRKVRSILADFMVSQPIK